MNTGNNSTVSTDKETSRNELLAKFLDDDSLMDLSLEGNDGVTVLANRHVLAARSEVFHRMLLGDFAEAKKDTIPIGHSGAVLKAIVEYIHTDTAEMLKDVAQTEADEDGAATILQGLIELAVAAAYFGLLLLCNKASETISSFLQKHPALAISALDVYHRLGPSVPKVKEAAMTCLSKHSATAVNAGTVCPLSTAVLEAILKDDGNNVEEFVFFEMLRLWAEADDSRRSSARDLVKHIRLEWISTNDLSTCVATSGLVSQEQLLETYFKRSKYLTTIL